MRHPRPEELFLDCRANPRSRDVRELAEAVDAFKNPVEVHFPDGTVADMTLAYDDRALLTLRGGQPLCVDHRGERLWVSRLPRTLSIKDDWTKRDDVWAAWKPDFVLDGPPSRSIPMPGVSESWVPVDRVASLVGSLIWKDAKTAADVSDELEAGGRARVRLENGRTLVISKAPEVEPGYVRLESFPPRGVSPPSRFHSPNFDDVVACKFKDMDGIAIGIDPLDRVGMCFFVPGYALPRAFLNAPPGGFEVGFRSLTAFRPLTRIEGLAVDAIQANCRISFSEMSRRTELNDQELDWAQTRMAPMAFRIIAAQLKSDGRSRLASELGYLMSLRASSGDGGVMVSALPSPSGFYDAFALDSDEAWSTDILTFLGLGSSLAPKATMAMADALMQDPALVRPDGSAVDSPWLAGAFKKLSRAGMLAEFPTGSVAHNRKRAKVLDSIQRGEAEWQVLAALLEQAPEPDAVRGPGGP